MMGFRVMVRKIGSMFLATAVAAGVLLMARPDTALAHCDSAKGPVVSGAMKALETGEIKWALAYVRPEAEAEMAAAFNHARAVQALGGEAQALAERFFAETTVRLHRVGEGADYTGIAENPHISPGLHAAEEALALGDPHEVGALLDKIITEGLEAYWHEVVEARERAEREGTVEALRAKAEAELIFEKYVYGLEQAAHGLVHGEEGSAAGGHSHGTAAPAAHHEAENGQAVVVQVNGALLSAKGVTLDGQAMVPLRAIAEALGGTVAWDQATERVTVTVDDSELVIQVGSQHAAMNGKEVTLPSAPAVHHATTLVPAHLLAEFLGLELSWDPTKGLVQYAAH